MIRRIFLKNEVNVYGRYIYICVCVYIEKRHVQIQTHTDSIAPNDDIESRIRIIKQGRLFTPDLGRQFTINDGTSQPTGLLNLAFDLKNPRPRKRNHTVALEDFGQIAMETLLLYRKRGQPLVPFDRQAVAGFLEELADDGYGRFFATQVDFLGAQPQDGICPCKTALRVADHLNLVDDAHIVLVTERQHLDGAGEEGSVFIHNLAFFASDHVGETRIGQV